MKLDIYLQQVFSLCLLTLVIHSRFLNKISYFPTAKHFLSRNVTVDDTLSV